MLLSLVYVSRATAPMSTPELLALRDQCSEHNLSDGITGLLLHRDGLFLQDLEGPEDSVLDLYARIQRDGRNEDVRLVWTQPSVDRRFPRWSMAFLEVGGTSVDAGEPTDPEIPEAAFVRELLDLFDTHA